MSPYDYLLMFVSSYCAVFLLGIQSKNVMASRYLAAVVTSAGISLSQFLFVKYAASGDWTILAVTTAGGCSGIATAIAFYDKITKAKK